MYAFKDSSWKAIQTDGPCSQLESLVSQRACREDIMVCPKINCFAEQEPSAEVENACTWCVQLLQEPSFFTSSQVFCFAFFSQTGSKLRKRSQSDPKDPKQASSGLTCCLLLSAREIKFLKNATVPRSMTRIRTFKFSKHNKKGRKGNIWML